MSFWKRKPKASPFTDARIVLTNSGDGPATLEAKPEVTEREKQEFLSFVERHARRFAKSRYECPDMLVTAFQTSGRCNARSLNVAQMTDLVNKLGLDPTTVALQHDGYLKLMSDA